MRETMKNSTFNHFKGHKIVNIKLRKEQITAEGHQYILFVWHKNAAYSKIQKLKELVRKLNCKFPLLMIKQVILSISGQNLTACKYPFEWDPFTRKYISTIPVHILPHSFYKTSDKLFFRQLKDLNFPIFQNYNLPIVQIGVSFHKQ